MSEAPITSARHLRLINDEDDFVLAYVARRESGQLRVVVAATDHLQQRGIQQEDVERYVTVTLQRVCETSPLFTRGETGEAKFDWWQTMRRNCESSSNAYMKWRWQYATGREPA